MHRWMFNLTLALGLMVGCGDVTPGPQPSTDSLALFPDAKGEDSVATDTAQAECEGLPNSSPCDDGDPCTLDDTCSAGACIGGTNNPCESDNPCETGLCVPEVGCEFKPVTNDTPCSVACYNEAKCTDGKCDVVADSKVACPAPLDDNPCVTELQCDPASGECTVEISAPEGTACDTDSNLCSLEECNVDGICQDLEENNDCASDKVDAPCELWSCSKKTGECQSNGFAGAISCDDGNGCTEADICVEDPDFGFSLCKGIPILVDDSNPCTDDKCVDGAITHAPINGKPCDPKSDCSPTGLCAEGVCEPSSTCDCQDDAECGDGNPCTDDSCSPDKTCSNLAKAAACDDGNLCTSQDVCAGGVCSGGLVTKCDDGNACTMDSCDPDSGCIYDPIAEGCDDGNPCTTNDWCTNGICQGMLLPACCGNGMVEGDELCDGNCPAQCPAAGMCSKVTLQGSAKTCDAQCVTTPVKECVSGDGCCPDGCSAAMDSDCGPSCGNGVVEEGETCDGNCPTSCINSNPCIEVAVLGSANTCDAQCTVIETNQCWTPVDECVLQIAVECHAGGFPAATWQVSALDNGITGALAPHGYLFYAFGDQNIGYDDVLPNWCLNQTGLTQTAAKSGCIVATYKLGSCVGPYFKTCQAKQCYSCP